MTSVLQLSVMEVVSEGLSSRERNRARRKARQASTRPEEEGEQAAPAKRQRLDEAAGCEEAWAGEVAPDNTGAWGPDVSTNLL